MSKKVAVVFGAGGIGTAIINEFFGRGYQVAVADMRVPDSIPASMVSMRAHFDITDEVAVNAFVREVANFFGRIDAVVITSGITRDGMMVKWAKGVEQTPETASLMSTEQFDAVMKTHVYGSFFAARAVMPYLIQSKGSLAFTSSIVARDGNLGQVNYTAAKCALEGMTRTMAKEVARYGVRVNAVGPGFTDTAMIAKMNDTPKGAQKLAELRAAGYVIQPKTIADEFLRLAEGTETGQIVYVDGGCRL